MTEQSVMELAKSGDPQAIATLINRSLASKGIHATAAIEAECLNISLRAAQIPNQKAVVTIIHRGMMILQVEQVKRVKILTHRSDNNYLAWQHEFNLGDYQKSAQSDDLDLNERLNIEQSQNVNLARNSKGVILVQKFSQIQQNSQEYQDIIVRFTDEQIGTVRCLTTLTELIQVISKPSFLFAAVAANPNLRSLLDTIAESSQTDEHGDQVITNLSILQPGQQWQKAKIRLVTKIFLEPNLDQEEQEQNHQGITLDLAEPVHDSNVTAQASIAEATISKSTSIPILEVGSDQSKKRTTNRNIEEINKKPASTLTKNEPKELTVNSDSITADSLFDDFAEPSSTSPQKINEVTNIDNQDRSISNQEISESRDTTEALFEDFSYAETSPQIISDHTQNTEFEDSLFDDFIIDSPQGLGEVVPLNASIFTEISQTEDAVVSRSEDDLFDNFNFEDQSTNDQSVETIKSEIDAIKSKIPKQDLDRLLALVNDGEQNDSQVLTNYESEDSLDKGTTTIEQVLGKMDTLKIDKKETMATSSVVTLEGFLDDFESLGF